MTPGDVVIRALTVADAEPYRGLRLLALSTAPTSFGSSVEEESEYPLETFRARLGDAHGSRVFGAFAEGDLIASAGFRANDRRKQRHRGALWGVFVHPDHRGRGLARRLSESVVAHARGRVLILETGVVASNHAARALYLRLGFAPFGLERDAYCIDGQFVDVEHLALDFRRVG